MLTLHTPLTLTMEVKQQVAAAAAATRTGVGNAGRSGASGTGYHPETPADTLDDSTASLLLRNDDALVPILTLCDLQSIGRLALTCRHLAAFVADPNQIFWLTHLLAALHIPFSEAANVRLGQDCAARTLLKAAKEIVGAAGDEWEYYHDGSEHMITVGPTGRSTYQIDYDITNSSSVFQPDDFAVRNQLHPVPAVPSTVVRRRRDGSNALDVGISSVSYFEVQLDSRRRGNQHRNISANAIINEDVGGDAPQACVAIGLSTKSFRLMGYQPGWSQDSIGFHSDDGQIFFSSGIEGTPYGPTYIDGDTIGCGVHIPSGSVFFTKNGSIIGTALVIMEDERTYDRLYPTIGMDSKEYSIHVNFGGDKQFAFDVTKAERLYSAYPPPTRQSRRLNSNEDATTLHDPIALLQQNQLICEYEEAASFHPWNAEAFTRRIYIQDFEWAMAEQGRWELDYNSYDDSSLGSADTGEGNGSENEDGDTTSSSTD